MSQVDVVVQRNPITITIPLSKTVAEAAVIMAASNIGAVMVVDEADRLVGILSERDILRYVAQSPTTLSAVPVGHIMTGDVVSCRRTARLTDINRVMVERRIRHLPVVEDGRPVAMISSRDVMAHQMTTLQGMKEAAEQTANLLKCLKTLNVDEVLSVAASEVPHIFRADRFMMSFDDGGDSPASCRRHCPCPVDESAIEETGAEAHPVFEGVPEVCRQEGCMGQRVLIPLGAHGPAQSSGGSRAGRNFLCMCGWPAGDDAMVELRHYKATLVQDILSTTLANAARYSETDRRGAIDVLTGLWMRRPLQTRLQDEVDRSARYGAPFCLAFLDVDHFKGINDVFGHAAGDTVLRAVAALIASCTRTTDFVARYGGDEFVILMPHTRLDEAILVVDRLRETSERRTARPDGTPVTLSCGVAQWSHETRGEELIARADTALYSAKRSGRNAVAAETP